jgi:hypothetical protein
MSLRITIMYAKIYLFKKKKKIYLYVLYLFLIEGVFEIAIS